MEVPRQSPTLVPEEYEYKPGFLFQRITDGGLWHVTHKNKIIARGQFRNDLQEWVDLTYPTTEQPIVEKYLHHGVEVNVISEVKGTHRQHCLCHQKCKFFKPNTPENCEIAQANYELCVKFNLTTPVYECAKYESEQ